MSPVIRFLIIFVLSFPTFALLFLIQNLIQEWEWLSWSEWLSVLGFTILQAFLSAFFSLLFGYWSAGSILKRKGAVRVYLEIFYLIPSIMPTLFVIISTMSVFNLMGELPEGLVGIVILHGVIHIGLVSIALANAMEYRLGNLADLARIDGANHFQFHLKVLLPLLKREILLIGFLVFSTCFASFSIPLVVGGLQGTTIEVLIYEKMRDIQGGSAAIYLSLLQVGLLFAFSFFIGPLKSTPPKIPVRGLTHWCLPFAMVPGVICGACVLLGQFWQIPEGLRQWKHLELNFSWLWPLVWQSFSISGGVGLLLLIILGLILYGLPSKWFQKYLIGYTSPSAALTGLVFSILAMGEWIPWKLVAGIAIISLPFCYRFIVDSAIHSLKGQIQVAQIMGASHGFIFRNVVWPQMSVTCGTAAGLGALWACGDFAFSSMVAESEITLALKIKNLLNSYRLELSVLLSWVMLICGGILFLCLRSLGYVTRRALICRL